MSELYAGPNYLKKYVLQTVETEVLILDNSNSVSGNSCSVDASANQLLEKLY